MNSENEATLKLFAREAIVRMAVTIMPAAGPPMSTRGRAASQRRTASIRGDSGSPSTGISDSPTARVSGTIASARYRRPAISPAASAAARRVDAIRAMTAAM